MINFSLRFCLVLALSGLAGCGFHLRGSTGASKLQDIAVEGIAPNDPLAVELKSNLAFGGATLVPAGTKGAGVVHVFRAQQNRRSMGLSRFGRTTTFDLSYLVVFEVRAPGGEVILPKQEVEVRRDYFNDQTLPLAQVQEEATIQDEMLKEAAQALLRRAETALKRSQKKLSEATS